MHEMSAPEVRRPAMMPLLAATACNTVQGAGQDIKNTGAWIEKKAGANK